MTADAPPPSADAAVTDETVVEFGGPYDLPRSLGVLQRGYADPAIRVDRGHSEGGSGGTPGAGAWMCQRIYGPTGAELGQATYRFDQLTDSTVRVRIAASSDASMEVAFGRAPQMLGAEDDLTQFAQLLGSADTEASAQLARVHRRNPGLRLPATGALFDQLVTVTLEQKVTHEQARHSWRNLLRLYGQFPARSLSVPAPDWMRLPLSPAQLRRVPSWSWHKLWVQPPLAATVQRITERASAVHRLCASTPISTADVNDLAAQLTAIPGVGPWTAAEALQRSHGAADLVAVGDYHLAHFVGEALTGSRTDDAGMLDLLAPYTPHRQRVVRLLGLSGFRKSRFGPRLAPEDHRDR